MTPKNIHKRFIPKRIFIFLKTPKNTEIQNIDPQKISPSLRTYENIRVPPPPPHTHLEFECLTLLKIEVIEYGKKGFKMAWNAFSETKIFKKFPGGGPLDPPPMNRGFYPPLILSPRSRLAPLASSFWLQVPPPPWKNLWVQPCICMCKILVQNFIIKDIFKKKNDVHWLSVRTIAPKSVFWQTVQTQMRIWSKSTLFAKTKSIISERMHFFPKI